MVLPVPQKNRSSLKESQGMEIIVVGSRQGFSILFIYQINTPFPAVISSSVC